MSLVLKDRVRETTTVIGTNDVTLLGAVTGFQAFSAVGSGNTCYYALSEQSGPNWEVGIGTYNSVGPTLTRDTILASSNSGSKVNFPTGTKDVFLTYPSERAVYLDANGNLEIDGNVVISVNSSSNALRITQTGSGNALVVEDSANPDATPFVISADGSVGVGRNPTTTFDVARDSATQLNIASYSATASLSPFLIQSRARGTMASPTIVSNGDFLGYLMFNGYDGASNVSAAWIRGEVDGTPGTNDMPGRLVFSTTPDGFSSPTERMRIDSAGRVGIGGVNSLVGVNNAVPLTGGTSIWNTYSNGVIQSGVTSAAIYYGSSASTVAAAFTLSELRHFDANQGTIGAGSTVSNQFGFYVRGSLTGATNNYGFYGNIASGTGRYNFYAAGTADNYFAGRIGVGTTATTSAYLTLSAGTNQLTLTTTDPTTYGRLDFGHFTNGAFIGTYAGTNTASDILRLGTNGTERMRIDSAGRVGIGGTPYAGVGLILAKNVTGGTTAYQAIANYTISSDVTSTAYSYFSYPATQASAFTLGSLVHYGIFQNTIGAGSTVTNQYGFSSGASLTGATNNYGFFSNIASGTGRFNFYAAGTAANYFAGIVGIGAATGAGQLSISSNAQTGSQAYDILLNGQIPSTRTVVQYGVLSFPTTAAAAFTLADLRHFQAAQSTLGAGSAITNQYGFFSENSLTGATNNYGFYSNIASGTGRWNFYAAGTAANYFAGNVTCGTVFAADAGAGNSGLLGTGNLELTLTTGDAYIDFKSGGGEDFDCRIQQIVDGIRFLTGGNGATAERMRITSAGDVLVNGVGGLGYGTGSGGAVTQTTSRTQGVTLNKTNGAITLVSAAGTTTWQSFTVTNSTVAATDTIIINQKSGTDLYEIHITAVAAGSFRVSFKTTGGTTTEQPVFNFAVIKAVTA